MVHVRDPSCTETRIAIAAPFLIGSIYSGANYSEAKSQILENNYNVREVDVEIQA